MIKKITFILCFSLLSIAAKAGSLDQQISQILNSKDGTSGFISIAVADGSNGQIIYNYHDDRRMVPASNLKLFIAAATLLSFGSDYRFTTSIAINPQQLKNGILKGNLYIRFVGDPSFTTDDLDQLLTRLKSKGINQIDGNIIIDNSRFAGPNYAFGWTQNDINWYYSAPITAVTLNENTFSVALLATLQIGVPTAAKVYRYADYIPLSNQLVSASQQQASHDCSLIIKMNEQNHLFLLGCWPARKDNSILSLAVKNPTRLAEALIKDKLASSKITFTGKMLIGKTPQGFSTIASHQSVPLSRLINKMLKHSDNFYAECLTKALASKYYAIGNFQNGVLAEKKILSKQAGLDFSHMNLFDGSGQSYYDHIQAKQMVKLLYAMSQSPIANTYYQSLPIVGVDGTMIYRMVNLRGKIHVKNGTMRAGNYTISGYMTTAYGKKLIFSILINNSGSISHARALQDKIVNALYYS
jgi:D-alanyl-D-alanine carboxypeptidase/D-alanyl-D-alanine-endopeptidase (penicillin-binding protein 4)